MSLSLPPKHVETLHKAALVAFPNEGALRLWVEFQLQGNLGAIKGSGSTLGEIILDVFYWVEVNQKWRVFLQAGIDTNLALLGDASREALAALPHRAGGGPAKPDAERDLVLSEGAPFIDRDPFWNDIQELRSSPRKRVALIDGPPKAGKSYCGELLDHLRRERWSGVRVGLIDLKNERSPDIRPEELCRRLLLKLRVPGAPTLPDPLPGQKPDRFARDLAAWMAAQISQLAGEVWVVLDGFGQPAVVEETHVFIAALAEEAGDQGEFRLILLGYDRAFADRTERATRRTRIDYLSASDLQTFFTTLDAELNISAKPGWAAAQEFVVQYGKHTPGSATQIDSLVALLPSIVRSLL